jgi:hypothetical protein
MAGESQVVVGTNVDDLLDGRAAWELDLNIGGLWRM